MKRKNGSARMAVVILLAIIFGFAWIAATVAAESKYATGSTSASVVFGTSPAGYQVTGLYAKSDKAAGVAKFYTRKSRSVPTAVPTNGATVIKLDNATAGIASNDVVVYVHASGVMDLRTAGACTTTNVTLTSGISEAGNALDRVYGLEQSYELPVGAGTLNPAGVVFAVPGDSPLAIVADGTGTVSCAATVDR